MRDRSSSSSGRSPTRSNRMATRSRRSCGVPTLVDDQRLADDLAGRHARVERGVGVLVDHLHAPAVGQHRSRVEAGDVLAVDADRAGGRLEQLQQRAPDRRLAAAALADQAQRLAAARCWNETPSTAWTWPETRENRPLSIGKCFLRSCTSSSGAVPPHRGWQRPRSCRASAAGGRRASRRPSGRADAAPAAATSARHWSVAKPQRGAKLQPCGRLNERRHHALDLVQPRPRAAPVRAASSRCGIEPSRPCV